MKSVTFIVIALVFRIAGFAQDEIPTFKVNTKSAVVWDTDTNNDSGASIVVDPLTGNEIHRSSSGGVEVSSILGYERVALNKAGKLINYTTTVANNTDSDVSVEYGGARVDGRAAVPLRIALTNKTFHKRDRKAIWELSKMHCFNTGFASNSNFFSADALSRVFTVRPKTALTISSVTTDPSNFPLLCSLDGCHIKATIRYYIRVDL